jgi:hypothetical protein
LAAKTAKNHDGEHDPDQWMHPDEVKIVQARERRWNDRIPTDPAAA